MFVSPIKYMSVLHALYSLHLCYYRVAFACICVSRMIASMCQRAHTHTHIKHEHSEAWACDSTVWPFAAHIVCVFVCLCAFIWNARLIFHHKCICQVSQSISQQTTICIETWRGEVGERERGGESKTNERTRWLSVCIFFYVAHTVPAMPAKHPHMMYYTLHAFRWW